MILVVMGVCGCGKTTVGRLLAQHLDWPFYEGDDFHPPRNIDKMSRGIALDDDDRRPWLAQLRDVIGARSRARAHAVLACSALRQSYRDVLSAGVADLSFVYLQADRDVLHARMSARSGHFMKAAMLDSQLATLEEPADALVMDASDPPARLVTQICHRLQLSPRAAPHRGL